MVFSPPELGIGGKILRVIERKRAFVSRYEGLRSYCSSSFTTSTFYLIRRSHTRVLEAGVCAFSSAAQS